MKRFSYFTLLSAVALAVSCEVSEPIRPHDGLIPFNGVGEAAPEWSEFIFTSDGEESSKTVHTNSTIYWSGGDAIRMGYTVNGYWQGTSGNASQSNPAKLYASNSLSEGGATASFTVPGQFTGSASGEYKFYTVYPASAAAEDCTSAPSTVVTIPTEQTPAATSFDPAADLMIGHSVRTYSSRPSEAIPLQWERKVAHGEITLKNFSGITGFSTDETIQSITLTAQSSAALTGSYSANLTTGVLTSSAASNSVTVSGTNLSWGADGTVTFWISILPVSITSLDVTLVTDKATYTKSFSGFTRVFAVNTRNQLGIKMTSATRTEKNYKLVTSATADWTGDYVLARTNSGTTYAMGGKSGTNDFSSVSTVTVTNDMISLTQGGPLNIRIDKSTNGYTIKFGNLYLGYTSDALSGSNCLYYSSTFSASKYEWTISLLDENYVEIKNVYNTSRTLRFNSNQKDRFACYNGSQWYPNLYRLGQAAGGDTPPDPQPEATATVTTEGADNIVQTSATLNGSFSGATGTISEVGFYWGTSNNNLSTRVVVSNTTTSPFSYELTGLDPNTTYYFKAFVKEYDGVEGAPVERCSAVASFTTNEAAQVMADYELVTATQSDWSGYYVLGYLVSSSSAILLTGVNSSNIGSISSSITVSSNKIAYSAGSNYEVTIAKTENGYSIRIGGKYLRYSGSGNNLYADDSFAEKTCEWTFSYSDNGKVTIANVESTSRVLQYNTGSPRFACYTGSQQTPSLFKRPVPEVSVTTSAATGIGNTTATFNGSYSIPSGSSNLSVTERGFYWGTTSNPTTKITLSGTVSSPFSSSRTGLSVGTTHYYKAYVKEYNSSTSTTTERVGSVVSFTTTGGSGGVPTGWLELPAQTGSEDFVGTFYGSGGNTARYRNYSYYYNYTYYASMWVAWPLCAAHTSGNASTSSWRYNPDITPNSRQVNIVSKSYGTMYGNDSYARGHQCPNADRKSDDTMNLQTYYSTNQTPQLQNKFNGSIWGSLETATRNLVTGNNASATMVYVVTGPVYRKVGGSETISYLTGASSSANPSSLAIPNYYWKALLKVQWNGDYVTAASAIGFWFAHRNYEKGESYTDFVVSVDQIEQWTGLDLFTNLPDGIEATAESNASWSSFQSFIGGSESAFTN